MRKKKDNDKKLNTIDRLLMIMMLASYSEVTEMEKLIKELNNPKDLAQRVIVLLRDNNLMYGLWAYRLYLELKKSKKR